MHLYLLGQNQIYHLNKNKYKAFVPHESGESIVWTEQNNTTSTITQEIDIHELLMSSNHIEVKKELITGILDLISTISGDDCERIILVVPDSISEQLVVVTEALLHDKNLPPFVLIRRCGLEMIGSALKVKDKMRKMNDIYENLKLYTERGSSLINYQLDGSVFLREQNGSVITLFRMIEGTPVKKIIRLKFPVGGLTGGNHILRIFADLNTAKVEMAFARLMREIVPESGDFLLCLNFEHGFTGEMTLKSLQGEVFYSEPVRFPLFFYNI